MPFKVFSKLVLRLWYIPVPIPIKYKVDVVVVLLIPTKVPIDPKPTLAVAIPIKSFVIFAAYTVCPWVRANPSIPSVYTDTAVPVFVL